MPDVRPLWPSTIALMAVLAVTDAHGQQDLDAGKTGPQLFAQDCSACHRSPNGLAKTMSGGSLVSFLREHYTSSSASASAVAAYVQAASNNRVDRQKGRAGEDQARPSGQPAPPPERSRLGRPAERPVIPAAGQAGVQAGPGAQAAPPPKPPERIARPADAAVDQTGRPGHKRRPGRHERAAESAAAGAAQPATPAAPEAASGGTEAAHRSSAPTAPSGFAEPLP